MASAKLFPDVLFILGMGYLYLGVLRCVWVRYAECVLVSRTRPILTGLFRTTRAKNVFYLLDVKKTCTMKDSAEKNMQFSHLYTPK